MKVLVVLCAVAVAALAAPEAPVYRAPARLSNEYGAPAEANEAPYPPSGWRPSGRQFLLPARQTNYYVPPPVEYGPPSTEAATEPPTEEPTTTEVPTTEQPEESNEFADGARGSQQVAGTDEEGAPAGVYYVLLPDGRLQRVAYSTNPAVPPPAAAPIRNSGYAQLQYMDVEPIRAPIYSYGSPFIRLF
ncbi:hypothetical protein R5R35_013408 [Gryllus longicercus]|uniref:DUF4794 domain-containing protein n=1 Tax=Gryllus longicercus TaxID=2509291 RepID=A0AAN9W149_9ORTH